MIFFSANIYIFFNLQPIYLIDKIYFSQLYSFIPYILHYNMRNAIYKIYQTSNPVSYRLEPYVMLKTIVVKLLGL